MTICALFVGFTQSKKKNIDHNNNWIFVCVDWAMLGWGEAADRAVTGLDR